MYSILTTNTPHSTVARAASNDHSQLTHQHREDVQTLTQIETGDDRPVDGSLDTIKFDEENGGFLLPARLGAARNAMSVHDRLARLNARY